MSLSPKLQSKSPFRTYLVMEFSPKIPPMTQEWLLSRITSTKKNGGGELIAKPVLDEKGEETIIHISATLQRLLVAAEEMQLKKPHKDGSLHEISLDDLDQFKDHEDLDEFLSLADRQRIVFHELQIIKATEADHNVPGMRSIKLYANEAIIPKCLNEELILNVFPLHDESELKVLMSEWCHYSKMSTPQPIEKVHRYFGETVAMYFSFLGFYTVSLIPPAFIGVISFFFGRDNVNTMVFFSIFNLVWATVFLEAWKRNCSTLAYKWGMIGYHEFEEPRPQYHGTLGINKVTGHIEPQYPKWRRKVKYYCVSVPIVLTCMFLAFLVMLKYFWMQGHAYAFRKANPGVFGMMVGVMPSVVYAVEINIMNAGYRRLAHYLNEWENHRLQSSYDNHLIVKLVAFDFANCFMSLFYVAFYMQDMALLCSHLGTLLIIQQVIGQIQETILPYLMYRRWKLDLLKQYKQNGKAKDIGIGPLRQTTNYDNEIPEDQVKQAQLEISRPVYEGTLDDYLEMFIQFGYVFLFSAVFPTAAFWALLNNITEIRFDAFKLCVIARRPFSYPTEGIGAWQIAFEMMSVIAVITNTALVALSPKVTEEFVPQYGAVNVFLVFVIVEHIILFVKVTLSFLIPDAPDWVETAVAREDYQSKLAMKQQKRETATKAIERKISHYHSPLSPVTILPGKINLDMTEEERNATPK